MKRMPYQQMTTQELAEATRPFDEPFVVDKSRPLTAAERRQWERISRKSEQRPSPPAPPPEGEGGKH